MGLSGEHQKQIRHYEVPGHIHELTWSCYQRWPLLRSEARRRLLGEAVNRATERHKFEVVAFVFMPEHVHLVVWPRQPDYDIAALLFAVKRPVSFRIKQTAGPALLGKLTVQERPGKQAFRFWQEGPGFDRNITQRRTLWKVIRYIHDNPIRRGLCRSAGDWPWSSWAQHSCPSAPVAPWMPRVNLDCLR